MLAEEEIQADEVHQAVLVLRQLQRLRASRHQQGVYERAIRHLERQCLRDAAYYRRRFELSMHRYRSTDDPHRHRHRESLQEAVNHLEASYMADKLRLLCEMAAQQQVLAEGYDALFATDLEHVFPAGGFATDPALNLWYLAWRINSSDDLVLFDRFRELLPESVHILPQNEQKQLYTYALNFCTRQINRHNNRAYFEAYLGIVDSLPDPELLLDANHELPPWRYINLVNAALQNERWTWALDFIHQWRQRLPEAYAENLFAFNLARWFYAQKQPEKALKMLATVVFDDPLLALTARSLHIKLLFETGEEELLFAALEANRLFLLRARHLAPGLRKQMQQFVDFTRKLAKTTDPSKRATLMHQLPPASEIMHRDWLEKQLET